MIADFAMAVGSIHPVCQDYGLTGPRYTMISDGCSSSPLTDVGARILCLAAQHEIETHGHFDAVRAVRRADQHREAMELPVGCLDATLGVLIENPLGVDAILAGDGVLIARRREGGVECITLTCSLNAPTYLNYLLHPDRLNAFQQAGGGVTKIQWKSPDATVEETDRCWVTIQSDFSEEPEGCCFRYSFPREKYDLVLVTTDGLLSFVMKSSPVPLDQVLQHLMSFKVMSDGFLRRRFRRFLEDTAQKGWRHWDDVALAAIFLP